MSAIAEYPYSYPTAYRDNLMQFSNILLTPVKKTLREASTDFDEEIRSYIEACSQDLQDAGVVASFFSPNGNLSWKPDSQILQAVRLYCLSVFGLYNSDSEKYAKSYHSLKATLCTQRRYTEESYGI